MDGSSQVRYVGRWQGQAVTWLRDEGAVTADLQHSGSRTAAMLGT